MILLFYFNSYKDLPSFLISLVFFIVFGFGIGKLINLIDFKNTFFKILTLITFLIFHFFFVVFLNVFLLNPLGVTIRFGLVGIIISGIAAFKTFQTKTEQETNNSDEINNQFDSEINNTFEEEENIDYTCPACGYMNDKNDTECKDCGLRLI